jgi:dTDP-4-dehydrorhamnose reductase
MRILVTGVPGLLSADLIPILRTRHEVLPCSLPDLDITDREAVLKTIPHHLPDLVINCAGYTNVDEAETHSEVARRVNALGVGHLALSCRDLDIPLLQISTDYVFDGQSGVPYQPDDPPRPLNVYGQTKWEGEGLVTGLLEKYYIVRTSSLYGRNGPNFVRTILDKAREGRPFSVVTDQAMSPTWAVNLSQGILVLIESQKYGTYHLTDRTDGGISWYDFARAILSLIGSSLELRPISAQELKRPAIRPAFSVLDTRPLTSAVGFQPLFWQEALQRFISSLPESDRTS